jgi:hypothetical protein
MKKLALLAALALMGSAAFAAAPVATVSLNNFDPDRPIFYLAAGTSAPFNKGINVQVWGGPVGGTLAALKTPTGADTFPILDGAAGYFDAGSVGIVPGVAAGADAEFQLVAFEGATFGAAQNVLQSSKWTQATKSEDVEPPALPVGTPLQISTATPLVIGPIPEPSTIALGLLGAAALLIRRRK